MSIAIKILKRLYNTTLTYKGVRVSLLGIPKFSNKNSYQTTIYRLNKKGYIEKTSNKWSITKSGKKYLLSRGKLLTRFESPFKKPISRNLILMFDVPENRKIERRWLRIHLKKFQYIMIQKSVWVGPSPLPKKFLNYTKEIGLDFFIKTFKLSRPYKDEK